MELDNLDKEELIELFRSCISEMKKRGMARTNSIIGELGEYIVIKHYSQTHTLPKLTLVDTGVQGYDAYDRKGKRYSIKTCTGKTTGAFFHLNDKGKQEIKNQDFDFIIICKMSKDFQLEAIYQLDWNTFVQHKKWAKSIGTWNLTLTKKMLNDVTTIYKENK